MYPLLISFIPMDPLIFVIPLNFWQKGDLNLFIDLNIKFSAYTLLKLFDGESKFYRWALHSYTIDQAQANILEIKRRVLPYWYRYFRVLFDTYLNGQGNAD